jgi:glycosyltransferase involved in cell wall biosynthesis
MSKQVTLGVVIPVKAPSPHLSSLIESLQQARVQADSIIIADASADTGIESVCKLFRVKHVINAGDRSSARNLGATLLSTSRILFLDADMIVSRDVISECLNCDSPVASIVEVSVGESLLARSRRWERQSYLNFGICIAPRLFNKSFFEQLGGYNPGVSSGEDYILSRKAEATRDRIPLLKGPILHIESDMTILNYLVKRIRYSIEFGNIPGLLSSNDGSTSASSRLLCYLSHLKRDPEIPLFLFTICTKSLEFIVARSRSLLSRMP